MVLGRYCTDQHVHSGPYLQIMEVGGGGKATLERLDCMQARRRGKDLSKKLERHGP